MSYYDWVWVWCGCPSRCKLRPRRIAEGGLRSKDGGGSVQKYVARVFLQKQALGLRSTSTNFPSCSSGLFFRRDPFRGALKHLAGVRMTRLAPCLPCRDPA